MNDSIRDYVGRTLADVRNTAALQKAQHEIETHKQLAQLRKAKPLDQQITELMRSLPPAMQSRGWLMAELLPRLTGKFRDRPHAKEVGEALRRLGWQRQRWWTNGYYGERVWIPPQP